MLRPHLFHCRPGQDIDEAVYYPVAVLKETPGRNHELAQALATGTAAYSIDDPEPWMLMAFFANALKACRPDIDETGGTEVWQQPSKRVAVRPHHTFTFEHDEPSIDFFREKMSWVMSRKKPSDSPAGRLFARLSEYADFVGLTLNYSGGKSLHIHAVFDTQLAAEALDLGAIPDPRPGFVAHWDLLRSIVQEVLSVPGGIEPDPMLRFPESYRRTPNAYRLVADEGHVLGVPPGTWVRQVALWEQWRERAASGATALFFRPAPFHEIPIAMGNWPRLSRAAASSVVSGGLTPEQITFCEEKLARHFGEWPKLDRLTHERGRWVARFFNSPEDRTPSSLVREDHRSIHLVGTGADGLHTRPLEFALGRMIWFWVKHHERLRRERGETPAEETVVVPRPSASKADHPLALPWHFKKASEFPSFKHADEDGRFAAARYRRGS